ncbi:MAG: flagellar biosynthetic protein FliO [Janthinobacterium lividum]
MSAWQDVSSAESHPFSFHLERAAKTIGHSHPVNALPNRVRWTVAGSLRAAWRWLQRARAAQTAARRLRVTETISLGEKRFLSIIQVDDTQFLIGSSTTNVHLLAQLTPQPGEAAQKVGTRESS